MQAAWHDHDIYIYIYIYIYMMDYHFNLDIWGPNGSALGSVVVNKLDQKTYANVFESHWMPHSYSLVPHLSKKLSKLLWGLNSLLKDMNCYMIYAGDLLMVVMVLYRTSQTTWINWWETNDAPKCHSTTDSCEQYSSGFKFRVFPSKAKEPILLTILSSCDIYMAILMSCWIVESFMKKSLKK